MNLKPLTKQQAIVLSACTGVMCMQNGQLFRDDVEARLGRKVTLEEWATEEFKRTVQDLYLPDFIRLCYRETGLILVSTNDAA